MAAPRPLPVAEQALEGGVLLATAGMLTGTQPLVLGGAAAGAVALIVALGLLVEVAWAGPLRPAQPKPVARPGGG